MQGNASWVAPGHNAVITYNNKTYNIYHALKGSSSGAATLRISEIAWDANGWPVSGGPYARDERRPPRTRLSGQRATTSRLTFFTLSELPPTITSKRPGSTTRFIFTS